ncbi:MAG: T9SS type A sorting domain-containing protein, partial [Bacteroidota bacterium]|nr:T9SS type A sorting domain-containing protein [Bacteroidota bacterium]
GQLQIHDLQGRIVQELNANFSSGTNQIPLHLSHLSKGLYVLKVLNNKNKTLASIKFRKQ